MNRPADRGGVTWAVVPFRGHGAKRRLARVLSRSERDRLARAMLDDVLETLAGCKRIDRLLVVTAEASAIEGLDPSVVVLSEPPTCAPVSVSARLNLALTGVQRQAAAAGVERLLIVPADLPMLRDEDLSALLEAADALADRRAGGEPGPYVVIAPDAGEVGTNALLLCPPLILRPAFGDDSFRAHVAQAALDSVRHVIVRRPGLAADIDTPDDLARMLADGAGSRTVEVLGALDLPRRLELAVAATGPEP